MYHLNKMLYFGNQQIIYLYKNENFKFAYKIYRYVSFKCSFEVYLTFLTFTVPYYAHFKVKFNNYMNFKSNFLEYL